MNPPLSMHPMSIGDVLDMAFSLYRRQFRTLFAIAAIVDAPVIVFSLAVSFLSAQDITPGFVNDPAALGVLYGLVGVGLCAALFGVVGGIVQTSALIFAFSEQFHGRTTSVRAAYRETLRHGASLAVCTLLLGGALAVLIACWICVVPLFLVAPLAVRWLFAYQAIMLEDADGVEGLRSSWALVRGQFWRTLGFAIVVGLMSYLVDLGPSYLASVLGFVIPDPRVASVLSTAAGSIVGLVLAPIFAGASTLYYYDLRMRQQGYDLKLLAQQIAGSAAA